MEAELRICCGARDSCHACFWIQVFDENNNILACCAVGARETKLLRLPEGCYKIRAVQYDGLSPGGVTKWLCMESGRSYAMCFRFSRYLFTQGAVPVCFTLSDANYPGITKMNGEIQIWRHPITR